MGGLHTLKIALPIPRDTNDTRFYTLQKGAMKQKKSPQNSQTVKKSVAHAKKCSMKKVAKSKVEMAVVV